MTFKLIKMLRNTFLGKKGMSIWKMILLKYLYTFCSCFKLLVYEILKGKKEVESKKRVVSLLAYKVNLRNEKTNSL